jgi:hypothetical protein
VFVNTDGWRIQQERLDQLELSLRISEKDVVGREVDKTVNDGFEGLLASARSALEADELK